MRSIPRHRGAAHATVSGPSSLARLYSGCQLSFWERQTSSASSACTRISEPALSSKVAQTRPPWGLGDWLTIDDKSAHHFVCPVTEEDTAMLGIQAGNADGQQVWECLAVLVAIDIRASRWKQSRIVLKVMGDNVGALTLLIRMRPHSPQIAITARGLGLRLVDLSFPPDAMHTPGVSHAIADRLSRIHAPGGTGILTNDIHPALSTSTVAETPNRDAVWYRACSDPTNAWPNRN